MTDDFFDIDKLKDLVLPTLDWDCFGVDLYNCPTCGGCYKVINNNGQRTISNVSCICLEGRLVK